ncbi:hypothetical protein IFM89_038707 [Coptis chinensis]|uniref:Uncharacterized protein n=1 Tax=Coptis chinensis TaxID=261450 RepID=A0A835H271_9MAGN|nr:hypothetical protein IFM89_038707 [Coptis chinensis]
MQEAEETTISRAFREDESRRNMPLPPENATRIMDVMRGISFGDFTPDWSRRVPEDRWIEEFRRLKQSPSTVATRN